MSVSGVKHSNKIHETRVDRVFNGVVYFLIILLLIIFIYPLWFVLMASVSDPAYVNSGTPLLWPMGFTTMGYNRVFADNRIWIGYANTILYAGLGMVVSTMVQVMAGYSLSRRDLPGRSIFMGLFVFTMYFGGGLIPFYLVVKQLNLVNSRILMIILGCSSVYNIIIARSFFTSSLPVELYEAASIDGCTNQRYFFSIVLPVARPAMAVLAMLTFLTAWNEFFWPIIALTAANPTVQVAIANLGSGYVPQRAVIMAGTLLGTLPVLVVFAFLGKQIVGGIMSGAVKG